MGYAFDECWLERAMWSSAEELMGRVRSFCQSSIEV
jgi:hypothetical protein